MLTVITTTRLRPGAEEDWDAAISDRFKSAHGQPGWVSGQLLKPTEEPDVRLIVGTWRSMDDWKAWHDDPAFLEQRNRLDSVATGQSESAWFDVVDDARAD